MDWIAIIAGLTLIIVTIGALGTVVQFQLIALDKQRVIKDECLSEELKLTTDHLKEYMLDKWSNQANINDQAIAAYVSAKAWETWKAERDVRIAHLERQVEKLYDKVKEA